jgi:hypothetical protein
MFFTKYYDDQSRLTRWTGHILCMGKMRNAYIILVGRLGGKRPFGRPRHS